MMILYWWIDPSLTNNNSKLEQVHRSNSFPLSFSFSFTLSLFLCFSLSHSLSLSPSLYLFSSVILFPQWIFPFLSFSLFLSFNSTSNILTLSFSHSLKFNSFPLPLSFYILYSLFLSLSLSCKNRIPPNVYLYSRRNQGVKKKGICTFCWSIFTIDESETLKELIG